MNTRLRELWRMPAEVSDQPARGAMLAFTIEYVKDRDAFVQRMQAQITDPASVLLPTRVELKDGRTLEVGSRPQVVDGTIIGRVWTVREIIGE